MSVPMLDTFMQLLERSNGKKKQLKQSAVYMPFVSLGIGIMAFTILCCDLTAAETADNLKHREVRILMSVNEQYITEALTAWLRAGIGKKYDLRITEVPYANKLLEHAQSQPVDIFILILNNMRFPDDLSYSPEIRVGKALKVVSQLKEKYKKPVIAMAGWPEDPAFGEKAKLAGANFFFRLPFNGKEFQKAIESCMDMLK